MRLLISDCPLCQVWCHLLDRPHNWTKNYRAAFRPTFLARCSAKASADHPGLNFSSACACAAVHLAEDQKRAATSSGHSKI